MNLVRQVLLMLLLFGPLTGLIAQSQTKEDSLVAITENAGPDSAKVSALIQLGTMAMKQPRKSLAYLVRAEKYADTIRQKERIALAHNKMGICYKNLEVFDSCRIYYWMALGEYRSLGDSAGVSLVENNIGELFRTQGMYQMAIEYLYPSLKIKESLHDTTGMFFTALNLGATYKSLKDYPQAMKFLNLSLQCAEHTGDKSNLAKVYNNIGNLYSEQGNYSEARSAYDKSLACNRELENEAGIARNYTNIGQLFWQQHNNDSARWYFNEGLKISEGLELEEGIQILTLNLATLASEENNLTDAKTYALRCYTSAQKQDSWDNMRDAAKLLAECYEKSGDYKNAFFYRGEYFRYRDSISNNENTKKITQEEMRYVFEKKENELKAQQEKDAILAAEAQRRSELIIYGVSGGLVLVILLLVFIFRSYRIKKKANSELSEKNDLIQHQKEMVEEKNKEILDSINYAKRIQYTLLAHEEVMKQNLPEHFVLFKPKDIVSGDFYWCTEHQDTFYLAVCDSTGHGVPGAFMSLLNISFLNEAINEKRIQSPDRIFNHVRERLVNSVSKDGAQDGMDAILLAINRKTNELQYAAANNAPLLITDGKPLNLSCDKMPVGKGEKEHAFNLFTIDSGAGGMLYLYTDGYADQFGGPKGKKFKYKQLTELLQSISNQPTEQQREKLESVFEEWKGNLEQVDDVCVIGIRI